MTNPSLRVLLASSAFALGAATLSAGLVPSTSAFAQAAKPAEKAAEAPKQEAPKQIELTQKQIDGLVSAQPALAKVQGGGDKPDPKAQEKVEAIAKKAGFANADEMEEAGDSVEAVLGGFDPEAKSYVGVTALLKKQIAEIEADKKIPAKDKAALLKDLKEGVDAGEPAKPSDGNVALVAKNYDKLSKIQGDQ